MLVAVLCTLCVLFVNTCPPGIVAAHSAPLRVGFLIDFESSLADANKNVTTTWPALKEQLQNNTNTVTASTPIEVIEFVSANMTTNATLLKNQVDVMAISNGFYEIDPNFRSEAFATICEFVNQGGGVVFHGWAFVGIGSEFFNASTANLLFACAPIGINVTAALETGAGWAGWYTSPSTSLRLDTQHAITEGLPDLWNGSILASEILGATILAGGATGLSVSILDAGISTHFVPLNDSAIVYMHYGQGGCVFVGFPYSGGTGAGFGQENLRSGTAADRLLRQAIVWSASPNMTTSATTTITPITSLGTPATPLVPTEGILFLLLSVIVVM